MATYSFWAEGKPQVKARPRLGRRGRVFTPEKTVQAEQLIARQYDGPTFEGPVYMTVDYFADRQLIVVGDYGDFRNEARLRGDLDNYVKLSSDALNNLAFLDDRQVKKISATVH